MALLLELVTDPFVWFCGACFVLPVWWEYPELSRDEIVAFYTHPAMIACAFLLLALVAAASTGPNRAKLTRSERQRARWYLLNAVVIHILMDGLIGAHKVNPLFYENYTRLDARYAEPIGSFTGALVHIVSAVELYVKGPMCILLYLAFYWGSPHCDALEFFTCVTQVYGTVVYLGQEMLSGMPHFDVDRDLTFSLRYLIYFWFAIATGCLLYLAVPLWLGAKSYNRLVSASRAAQEASAAQLCATKGK